MLRIRVLGDLELEADGEPLDPPAGRPARALLGWLALHPGTHARSTVAGRLWPDVLEGSARKSLRTALSAVRASVGPAAADALVTARETIALAGEPDVWVDVRAFEALVAEGRHQEALALCRGELLAGLDDEWVLVLRDEHRERRAHALRALADAAAQAGDHERAVQLLRSRATLDPLDEPAQRDLMCALAAAGDRAGALGAYERFVERLRRELGVAPSAETRRLAATLRAGAPIQQPMTAGPRRRPVRYARCTPVSRPPAGPRRSSDAARSWRGCESCGTECVRGRARSHC